MWVLVVDHPRTAARLRLDPVQAWHRDDEFEALRSSALRRLPTSQAAWDRLSRKGAGKLATASHFPP
jgi:hypothetical protein